MTRLTEEQFTKAISAELHEIAGSIPVDIRIGITGSRVYPTDKQKFSLGITINTLARSVDGHIEMHHGMCVGTDECAHYIGAAIPGLSIIGHPGYGRDNRSPYRMHAGIDLFTVILPAQPYNKRNRAIVYASTIMVACPLYIETDPRSAQSGTWQTIRMARRAHKPLIIIPPTGTVQQDH